MKTNTMKCSKKLPGYFMSDPARNCFRKPTMIVGGSPYCYAHGRKALEKLFGSEITGPLADACKAFAAFMRDQP